MRAVIMAAGVGSRISRNIDRPKSLLEIEGKSILRRTVEMLRANNIEPCVVAGYMHEQIEENLKDLDVKIFLNPFYKVTNSLGSLWFARDFIKKDEPLLLANADVFWEEELLNKLLDDDKEIRDLYTEFREKTIVTIVPICLIADWGGKVI